MTKLIIVLDIEEMTKDASLPTDPAYMAAGLLVGGFAGFAANVASATYDYPPTFMRPADHEERIKVAEQASTWYLGSPGYASTIFTAYEHPERTKANLKAEMEDDGD